MEEHRPAQNEDEIPQEEREALQDESAGNGVGAEGGDGNEDSGTEDGGTEGAPRPIVPAWVWAIVALLVGGALVWTVVVYLPQRLNQPPTPTVATKAVGATATPTAAEAAATATSAAPAVSTVAVATTAAATAGSATATAAATPTAIVTMAPTPSPPPGPPLILVADLGGDRAAALSEALLAQAGEHPDTPLRVERLSQEVDAGSVEAAGREGGATYVLWGRPDGTLSLHALWWPPQQPALGNPDEIPLCQPSAADATDAVAALILGIHAYAQGDTERASDDLAHVLEALPQDADCPADAVAALLYLGNAQVLQEKYADALATYERGIERAGEVQPGSPLAGMMGILYGNRGAVYHVQGDEGLALADLNRALQWRPTDADLYHLRGNVYRGLEQNDAALQDYARTLEYDPGHPRVYASRGLTYHNLGEYDKALADYAQALERAPDLSDIYLNRGGTYAAMGNYAAALADYTRAIELSPQDADAYYNRGTVYAITEQYDAALADYERALQLDPELAQVYGNRGLVYSALGDQEAAIADLERFLELSDNPEWREIIEQQLQQLRAQGQQ